MKASLVNTNCKVESCSVWGSHEDLASVHSIFGIIEREHCLIHASAFKSFGWTEFKR